MRSVKLLVLKHGLVCVSRFMFDMQTELVQILLSKTLCVLEHLGSYHVLTRVTDKLTHTAYFENDNFALSI